MFKIIGWIILIVVAAAIFYPSDNKNNEITSKKTVIEINQDEIRLENATTDQKACVKTLGQGVYKNKSLSWKLDTCNVSK